MLVGRDGPTAEAGEVPPDMLSKCADAELRRAFVRDKQCQVPAHDLDHFAERRCGPDRLPGERLREFAKQPRLAETSAADDDTAQPVSRIIASASAAAQISPLPSTGIAGDTASRSAAIADQSAAPEYSCSAVRACNEIAAAPASSA